MTLRAVKRSKRPVCRLRRWVRLTPIDGLDLSFGASFLDTKVKDVGMPSGMLQDRDLVVAPDFSFNGLARYEWPAFGGTMSIQGDFNFVDDMCFTVICNPTEEQDSYVVGNLRAGYSTGDEKWSFYAFVYNVGDEEYLYYSLDATFVGFAAPVFAKPRWFGGSVSYRW